MKYNQTPGIVLHTNKIGEADCISTILTKKSGKQKFLFKGLRKSKKRSQTSAEPGSIININYFEKNNKDYIIAREFSLEKYYPALRSSLQHLYSMFYILELTEKTTGFNNTEVNLYNIVFRALDTLASTSHPLLLLLQFQLHLMRFQGILPDLNICSSCKTDLSGFYVSVELTVSCPKCTKDESFYFTPHLHNIIGIAMKTPHPDIDITAISQDDLITINFHLALIIEHYHEIILKSKDILFEKK
jgi:DNA repair protein RecO